MVRSSLAKASINVFLPFFKGIKPSKIKLLVGKPLLTSAGTNAVAPGKLVTGTPAALQARTNKNAGSEIPGVPASVMSAIFFPASNCCTKCSTTLCSLC